jgi:hypothetical protein
VIAAAKTIADHPPGKQVRVNASGDSLGEDRPKNKNQAMRLATHSMVFA